MPYPVLQPAIDAIESAALLDDPSAKLRELVRRLIPEESRLKDILSGTWLGHPLHALLTDVVVGTWASAAILDLIPTRGARKSADKLLGVGVLAALPTAAAGLSDWVDLGGKPRRIGFVHGVGNMVALYLQATSYVQRKRHRRFSGWLRSAAAMGIASGTAYLGGHLTYAKGVGVNQTAFEEPPQDFVAVLDADKLPSRQLTRVEANGIGVVLYKTGNRIQALGDRCPHRGCSLADGHVNEDSLTCVCHGSTFRLSDGALLRGPATVPAPRYEARRRQGKIEVRLPGPH